MGSGEAFATIDREGRFTYLNEQAEFLLGQGSGHLLGRAIWSTFQKTVRLRLEEQFRRGLARGEIVEAEELDASLARRIEARGYPFGGGLAVHLRDVTARHKSQEQLRLLESSIARLNDIVIITEAGPFSAPGPRIVFVNEAFERRTGYTPQEVLGRTPRLLQGPGTQRKELDRIRFAMEQWKPARVDLINYKKNGEAFWVDLEVSPVWDHERRLTHWVAVGRDITERKMAEEKIQYLAFYDPLTKLPNRQLLLDRLQRALSDHDRPREGALMFIDLDNFKVLNDTLGHQKGDLLLQQVAERLRSCVARGDTVARLGGDEFVILLENSNAKPLDPASGARIVSERILARLGEPYVLSGYLHHSTCSIGVTLFGDAPWTRQRAAQAGGPGDVPGQERGPQHRVLLRPGNAGGRDGQRSARHGPAGSVARRPVPDRLPAAGWRGRAHDGRGGAAALEAPAARHGAALALHPHRRGNFADHPDRPLGARTRVRAAGHLGVAAGPAPPEHRRERERAPVPPPGLRGRGDDGHQARGRAAAQAQTGTHGEPAGRGDRSDGGQDGQPEGNGRDAVAGRLRHGLFVVVLPQAAAARPAQDRP